MFGVNSHEKYMECSLGVFNGNLLKRVELNGWPTVKRAVISVNFYPYYNECVFNYTNLGGTAMTSSSSYNVIG